MSINSNYRKDKAYFLKALLRQNFYSFTQKAFLQINQGDEYQTNWHLELLSDYLTSIAKGDIKRLIINLPPRNLKSILTSVAFPAWILGHNPSKKIIVASYAQTLSIKHSLDCRLIMESEWYKNIFPKTILSKDHNQKSKFLTTLNGFRMATSTGSAIIGEGADYLILDDPHNLAQINSPKEKEKLFNWFQNSFLTRLNDRNKGAIIIVMQRISPNDLTGYLIDNNSCWEIISLPIQAKKNLFFSLNNKKYEFREGEILNPKRYNINNLVELEKEIGSFNYAAQYMQEPLSNNSSILNFSDLNFYKEIPSFEYFILSLDTAIKTSIKSDYSVCACFGVKDKTYYLISLLREKLTYPQLKDKTEKQYKKYSPKYILIEDKASGQQLLQDLKFAKIQGLIAIKPKNDKITRFASVVPLFRDGTILLPEKANFNHILFKELLSFPNSAHDDIIDSISQFLNFAKTLINRNNNIKRISII